MCPDTYLSEINTSTYATAMYSNRNLTKIQAMSICQSVFGKIDEKSWLSTFNERFTIFTVLYTAKLWHLLWLDNT